MPVSIIVQSINAFPVLKAMTCLKLTGIVIIIYFFPSHCITYYQVHFADPLGMYVSYNEHLVKIPKPSVKQVSVRTERSLAALVHKGI